MSASPEVQRRIAALDEELTTAAHTESRNATRSYRWSQFFLILAVSCSVGAAVAGIFIRVDSRIVGGLAALPPVLAYVAVSLKLDIRENWYYGMSIGLEALRSRLLYQLPENPTVDNVSAIASARDQLIADMQKEWHETITKSLIDTMKQKMTTPRSRGTSAGQ